MQGCFFGLKNFLLSNAQQVADSIGSGNALEVKNLTTAKDSRQDLMLLRSSQDEDGIRRWLLQRLQEGVEGRGTQHVHLIDDIDLVATLLRRKAHAVYQFADIIHRIVRR